MGEETLGVRPVIGALRGGGGGSRGQRVVDERVDAVDECNVRKEEMTALLVTRSPSGR